MDYTPMYEFANERMAKTFLLFAHSQFRRFAHSPDVNEGARLAPLQKLRLSVGNKTPDNPLLRRKEKGDQKEGGADQDNGWAGGDVQIKREIQA